MGQGQCQDSSPSSMHSNLTLDRARETVKCQVWRVDSHTKNMSSSLSNVLWSSIRPIHITLLFDLFIRDERQSDAPISYHLIAANSRQNQSSPLWRRILNFLPPVESFWRWERRKLAYTDGPSLDLQIGKDLAFASLNAQDFSYLYTFFSRYIVYKAP